MSLRMEDKREQDKVFKFHSYSEIVKFGIISFVCFFFFSKIGDLFLYFRNDSLTGQCYYLVNYKVLCK